jgi:hypothetical protein
MDSVTVSELNRQTAKAANLGPIPPTPPRDSSEETVSLSATLAEMRNEERY